jgi:hypothetical protein
MLVLMNLIRDDFCIVLNSQLLICGRSVAVGG